MADTAMTEETTPAPETKVDEREFIALLPHAWGRDKHEPVVALMNCIKAFADAGMRSALKKEAKSLPFRILEVTGDWEINDFGTVSAKTIKEEAKGEVPLATAKKVWDAFEDVEMLIQDAY